MKIILIILGIIILINFFAGILVLNKWKNFINKEDK